MLGVSRSARGLEADGRRRCSPPLGGAAEGGGRPRPELDRTVDSFGTRFASPQRAQMSLVSGTKISSNFVQKWLGAE